MFCIIGIQNLYLYFSLEINCTFTYTLGISHWSSKTRKHRIDSRNREIGWDRKHIKSSNGANGEDQKRIKWFVPFYNFAAVLITQEIIGT